jgi:hypothetical protein
MAQDMVFVVCVSQMLEKSVHSDFVKWVIL